MSATNGKTIVGINRCPDYKDENVQRAVDDCLAAVGGIDSIVKSGQKVLIKPNLLLGKLPRRRSTRTTPWSAR